jgi:hypothetical protein
MTIRKLYKQCGNKQKEEYKNDSFEFHSIEEVKDFCRKDTYEQSHDQEVILYVFIITDTNEEIDIFCQWITLDNGDRVLATEATC